MRKVKRKEEELRGNVNKEGESIRKRDESTQRSTVMIKEREDEGMIDKTRDGKRMQ